MGQILDHRETVKGLHRLAHTVCESVEGRWRDGAGSLPTFGIQSHTDACTHVEASADDGTDFGPSRNGEGAAPAAA